ncbi:MAG: hypothetical protein QG593_30 [Patescibacteria group bacterium]|jgi:hypothetical protein|nr:hypothetical protein [Patescibacteria group bacterium]
MLPQNKIDISENTLRNRGGVLDILLIDRTRHKPSRPFNIIWATDSYLVNGKDYAPTKQIRREQVTGVNGKIIQPRAAKSKEEQKYRTKDKAEVFTPLHVVEEMNIAIDKSGKNYPVNTKNWIDYIKELKLEITCGEGPFITGRYNPTANTGVVITTKNRVGFFDRKLQQLNKYATSKKEWLEYAEIAVKATYGYEWQGDNLLIARENVLLTLDDFYKDFCIKKLKLKSKQNLTDKQLEYFAEIISWNIFQMDGLSYTVPMTRIIEKRKVVEDGTGMLTAEMLGEERREYTLEIKKNGTLVKIMDWSTGKSISFVNLLP